MYNFKTGLVSPPPPHQLHVKISQRKIKVSNIPNLPIPEEWVKDKLELNFCKTKLGGGEVKDVTYDRRSQMALITFVQPGGNF